MRRPGASESRRLARNAARAAPEGTAPANRRPLPPWATAGTSTGYFRGFVQRENA
jgi:hypothetical protein